MAPLCACHGDITCIHIRGHLDDPSDSIVLFLVTGRESSSEILIPYVITTRLNHQSNALDTDDFGQLIYVSALQEGKMRVEYVHWQQTAGNVVTRNLSVQMLSPLQDFLGVY